MKKLTKHNAKSKEDIAALLLAHKGDHQEFLDLAEEMLSKYAVDRVKRFAGKLEHAGYSAVDGNTLAELMNIKEEHEKEFERWCKNHTVDPSDQVDNDFILLGKFLNHLIEEGYFKH